MQKPMQGTFPFPHHPCQPLLPCHGASHNLGTLWPIMERGWHAQSKTTSLPSDKHPQKLHTLIKLNMG